MKKNRVALLIGAGAVENAWTPVIKAIKEFMHIETTPDGANFIFANFIYMLRIYAAMGDGEPRAPIMLDISKRNTYFLKEAVAEHLRIAQENNEIKARPALKRILEKFVISDDNDFGFATTNWDKTTDEIIDQEVKRFGITNPPTVFHIHGHMNDCNSLYLPSEFAEETFRTREESKKIGQLHIEGFQFFMEATHIILYGISLDPLDAELSQMLRSACNFDHLKEVTIINLENEKHRVSERVRLLFFPRNRNIKVNFIDASTI
ncbi:hypothetical protein [Flavobacterium lindanitolerans]|uniref:hypothetical protein n=1 Tax=Flavobacterium lindanitolerans TaxID=428988 RepID=UPI0031A5E47C